MKNLIKSLLDKFDFSFCVLFSDTAFNGDYSFLRDKDLIYESDEMDEQVKLILTYQIDKFKKNKVKHGLIILDDVKLYNTSKSLTDLASKGRHYKLTVICSVQFAKTLISPAIRGNLDYLFFSDLNINSLKPIYESIVTKMSFNRFVEFVDDNNHHYQFIFYNGRESDKTKRLKIVKSIVYSKISMI